MTTSVLIPCHRAANTIGPALESVLAQTRPPSEVIVLLDGESDETESRLERFQRRIRLLKQSPLGAACARNRLIAEAHGSVLAFLDADDVWHPKYLETQSNNLQRYPGAVAAFTGHVCFRGGGNFTWDTQANTPERVEILAPHSFLVRFNTRLDQFASMSFCCVRKKALDALGSEPFSTNLRSGQDLFLYLQLTLIGAALFDASPLVAYRFSDGSLSSDRIRSVGLSVDAFEQMARHYRDQSSRRLEKAFLRFYASRRRHYAKLLLGADRTKEAREQLLRSVEVYRSPISAAKSVALLLLSGFPRPLQPAWPSGVRQVNL